MWRPGSFLYILVLATPITAGCGTTKASDQLLLSDAVERAVSAMDFRLLANQRVYLDMQYVSKVKNLQFINLGYIESSIRHQLMACGCRIESSEKEAEYVVEVRLGALGTDDHTVTIGVPESRNLNSAASLVANVPVLPTVPEIALARRNDRQGAAKLIAFAYHQKTKRPVWQSDVAIAKSTAQDTWLFGAGPFQRGTIYKGVLFAGTKLGIPSLFPRVGTNQSDSRVAKKKEPMQFRITDENGSQRTKIEQATIVKPLTEEDEATEQEK